MNVLLGVTGSIAAKLTPKLEMALEEKGHTVKTVLTNSAMKFTYSTNTWYEDEDEWDYYKKENKVLHIDLVNWSDVLVIAPCTANTLSKIHSGICDNLLTCCVRAWDWEKKIIIAPAMNTGMYNKSNTEYHRRILTTWGNGFTWIPPQVKTLYCGDTGIGAMANIEDIVNRI